MGLDHAWDKLMLMLRIVMIALPMLDALVSYPAHFASLTNESATKGFMGQVACHLTILP